MADSIEYEYELGLTSMYELGCWQYFKHICSAGSGVAARHLERHRLRWPALPGSSHAESLDDTPLCNPFGHVPGRFGGDLLCS